MKKGMNVKTRDDMEIRNNYIRLHVSVFPDAIIEDGIDTSTSDTLQGNGQPEFAIKEISLRMQP